MLSRDSAEYMRVCDILNIDTSWNVSIPKEILDFDEDMINELYEHIKMLDENQNAISAYLNQFRKRKGTVAEILNIPTNILYRAFFITSRYPVFIENIRIKNDNKILRMYGGECIQIIKHYHYVIIVEFACELGDVSVVNSSICNITGISTNTVMTIIYIRGQLRSIPYTKFAPGHELDEWYNPYYKYNSKRNIAMTNNVGYRGVFCDTIERSHPLKQVVQLDTFIYSVFKTRYTGGSCTNITMYKRQYNIIVTRGLFSAEDVYNYFNNNEQFKYSRVILII